MLFRSVIRSQEQGYILPDTFNRLGLGAVEYLGFAPKEHSCPRPPPPLLHWNTQDLFTVDRSRCSYLGLVMEDLSLQSRVLSQTVTAFIQATRPVSQLSQPEIDRFIQNIVDGLFYLDAVVKDTKLGQPAGMKGCGRQSCFSRTEHRYAQSSIDTILQNLRAVREVFHGSGSKAGARGFYDYLHELGAVSVADGMLYHLDQAIANLEGQESSLLDLAKSSGGRGCWDQDSELCQHYADVKQVTDDLKGEFLKILQLRAPDVAQGDAD